MKKKAPSSFSKGPHLKVKRGWVDPKKWKTLTKADKDYFREHQVLSKEAAERSLVPLWYSKALWKKLSETQKIKFKSGLKELRFVPPHIWRKGPWKYKQAFIDKNVKLKAKRAAEQKEKALTEKDKKRRDKLRKAQLVAKAESIRDKIMRKWNFRQRLIYKDLIATVEGKTKFIKKKLHDKINAILKSERKLESQEKKKAKLKLKAKEKKKKSFANTLKY